LFHLSLHIISFAGAITFVNTENFSVLNVPPKFGYLLFIKLFENIKGEFKDVMISIQCTKMQIFL